MSGAESQKNLSVKPKYTVVLKSVESYRSFFRGLKDVCCHPGQVSVLVALCDLWPS